MLNQDYKDILFVFIEEEFEFLLVEAYAMAVYGLPRATGDIDLWVRRSSKNVARIIHALTRFGAPLTQVNEKDFNEPEVVFQIGVASRRIDILSSITGVEFEAAWLARKDVEVEGM